MSGMRNHRRVYNSPAPPLDFAKGRLVYTSQIRSRNRQYRLAAILLVLAVATGVLVVLLANFNQSSRQKPTKTRTRYQMRIGDVPGGLRRA